MSNIQSSLVKLFSQSEIRFVSDESGKFEFGIVADDLAKAIEHSDTSTMSNAVDEDYKGTRTVCTLGGSQSMIIIWEPGIYQLLAKSRKPKAKPFQKWLFEEVLPEIRKTGRYNPSEENQPTQPQLPTRDTIDYIDAADKLGQLRVNSQLKMLLEDALTDELELMRNRRLIGSGLAEKKEYTIAKVRAKELGYSDKQIGSGSALGRFVAKMLDPKFQKRIGDYNVNHYEVTPQLDEVIHAYFR
jgi:prophage antirepressor-like protein